MDFLESSLLVQKQLGMKHRAKNGIFFTPKPLRDIILRYINITPKSVLEPTCGSGEFLTDCEMMFPEAKLEGVELDETLSSVAKENAPRLAFDGGKLTSL